MKLFVAVVILGVCSAARLDNTYLPPRGGAGSGFGGSGSFGAKSGGFVQSGAGFGQSGAGFGHSGAGFGQSGAGFGQSGAGFGQSGAGGNFGGQHSGNAYNAPAPSFRQQSSADAGAQILRSNSEVTAEGFSYDFETSNGIRADARGVATNGVQSQGSFGYKGDDGQDYSITYTADENGYQPQGAHLPTPPPIPEAILKSLEQNARDEAAGISDDGSYHGEGAGGSAGGYSGNSGNSGFGGNNGYPSGPAQGSFGGSKSSFGGSSGSNFGASAGSNFGASAGSKFGGSAGSNFGARGSSGSFGAKSFGGSNSATSRQYLTPNAGPRGNGNGNFNPQSGYQY